MKPRSTRYSSNLAHAGARTAASRRTGTVPAVLEAESRRTSAWQGSLPRPNRSRSGSSDFSRLSAQKSTRSRAASAAAGAASYGGTFASVAKSSMAGASEADAPGTDTSEGSGFSPSVMASSSRRGAAVSGATPSAQLLASSSLAKKVATVPVAPVAGSASKTLKRANAVELDILMKRRPGSFKKDPAAVKKLKDHRKMVLRRRRKAALKQASLGKKAERAVGGKLSRKLFKGRKGRKQLLSLRERKNRITLFASLLSFGGLLLMGAILASSLGLVQFGQQAGGASNGGSLDGDELATYLYLKDHGCDDIHAAAIMGNYSHESAGSSNHKIYPMADQAMGSRAYWLDGKSPKTNDDIIARGSVYNKATGIGQWDGGRRLRLAQFAKDKGRNWYDLEVQLEFWSDHDEWGSFSSADGKYTYQSFMDATDLEAATKIYAMGWERCAMVGGKPSGWESRFTNAQYFYNAITSGTLGGSGQGLAGATGSQLAVVNACNSTPSPGQNWCAAWVTNVFKAAGVGTFGGNACDMVKAWCHSNNPADLKVGMIVGDASHPGTGSPGLLYGHVGIYVGDGKVMSNEGAITTKTLDEFIAFYGKGSGVYWGWIGGVELK